MDDGGGCYVDLAEIYRGGVGPQLGAPMLPITTEQFYAQALNTQLQPPVPPAPPLAIQPAQPQSPSFALQSPLSLNTFLLLVMGATSLAMVDAVHRRVQQRGRSSHLP